MKIQLKRSGVLDNGVAKKPTAVQTEYGELCVNYNAKDPTLFIKDSNDAIIPIAGDSHILNIIEENSNIDIDINPPGNPSNGNIWLNMSTCPPSLLIWSDCDGQGQWYPISGAEALQFPLMIASTNGNDLGSTLTAIGGDGVDNAGRPLEPEYTWTGAKTGTGETILADIIGIYSCTATITNGLTTYTKTARLEIIDSYELPEALNPPVIGPQDGGRVQPGKNIIIERDGTIINGIAPYLVTRNFWFRNGELIREGFIYTVDDSDVGKVISLSQEITDGRGNGVPVGPSNGLQCLDYLGYIVTPTVLTPSNNSGTGDNLILNSDTITDIIPATPTLFSFGSVSPADANYEGSIEACVDGNLNSFLGVNVLGTATINVTLATAETGTLYVYGGNGTSFTNDDNRITLTNGGSSAGATFTDNLLSEVSLGAVTNWTEFSIYAGTGDNGGCYIHKFMIDRGDGKGKVNLIQADADAGTEFLEVASEKDIDNNGFIGDVYMTDGTIDGSTGQYAHSSYTPNSSPITNIDNSNGSYTELTVENNADLKYFKAGQIIAGKSGAAQHKVTVTLQNSVNAGGLPSGIYGVLDGSTSTYDSVKHASSASAGLARFGLYTTSNQEVNWKPGDVIELTLQGNIQNMSVQFAHREQSYGNYTATTALRSYTWTIPSNGPFPAQSWNIATRGGGGANQSDYLKIYKLQVNGNTVGKNSNGNQGYVTYTSDCKIQSVLPDESKFRVDKSNAFSIGETFNGTPVSGTGSVKDVFNNRINLESSNGQWVGTNLAGTQFSVAGPVVIDTPLLTSDVELRCTSFRTDPQDIANLRNIVWEIDGVEESAGTSNPYKPFGLAPSTTHTVRVKHQANDLNDSAYSSTVSFTTGLSRSLYDYQQIIIDGLTQRITALESGGY